MVNLLPLPAGERITTILPLPEDEASWDKLQVVFATKSGDVRRNELSDFPNINKTGKIAMKLEEGDGIVGVQLCTENDDVLLTTRGGKCIRFAITDIRVFKGRESTGVRGIKLAQGGDEVVSLALLGHGDASVAEARAYLRQATAARRAAQGEAGQRGSRHGGRRSGDEEGGEEATLSPERYAGSGRARAVRARGLRAGLRQAHQLATNTASRAAAARASSPWPCASKNSARSWAPSLSRTATI